MASFRDGGALSFTPAARKSRTLSRVLGVVCILAALAGGYLLFQHDRAEYPALVSGQTDTGILNGFAKKDGKTYASVVLLDASKSARTVSSIKPVESASKNDLGRAFTVHYTDQSFKTTFIDGIDQVKYTEWGFVSLGAGALGGLMMILIPFKVRARK